MSPRSQHATLAARLATLGVAVALVLAVGQSSVPAQPEHVHAAPAEQATATPAPVGGYLETFTLTTDHPEPIGPSPRMDIFVHSRDYAYLHGLDPMVIDHGSMCEAPPTSHPSSDPMLYAEAVFGCKDHLMTAIDSGPGYGLVYLTPASRLDWSTGEAKLSFDLSTFRHSDRDWMDFYITPFEDLMVAPFDGAVDLQGVPKRAIHVIMQGRTIDGTSIQMETVDNHFRTILPTGGTIEQAIAPLTTSQSRRDTFELKVTRTHLSYCMPAYNYCFFNASIPDLGWDKGVVQFGHHSYNPTKDCSDPNRCQAGTWHWDNIALNPAVPFTLIPARERLVDIGHPVYTFAEPAPANSYLQMALRADSADISLDNGATWQAFPKQDEATFDWSMAHNYWGPIPAGTTSVMLRAVQDAGEWDAEHAAILSLDARPQPTPTTPPPTATPLVTNTPAPPTSTPLLPTGTPLPPTATSVPATSTAVPAVTATPFPATATTEPSAVPIACQVQVTINGTPGPLRECR